MNLFVALCMPLLALIENVSTKTGGVSQNVNRWIQGNSLKLRSNRKHPLKLMLSYLLTVWEVDK